MRENYGSFGRERGRLEYKKPVAAVDSTGTAAMLPGNGSRVALMLCFAPPDDTTVEAKAAFSDTAGAAAKPHTVLTEGMTTIILRECDVGDLIKQPVFVVSPVGASSIFATEIVWHPEED